MNTKLSVDEMAQLVAYNGDRGEFLSLNTYRTSNYGEPIGRKDKDGYLSLHVRGRSYRAHHVAWALTYGEWPEMIDHINGDRADNRIANLRKATCMQNSHNQRKAHRDSAHGLLGVDLNKSKGRFRARIQVAGKRVTLGGFGSAEEAHLAYVAAKRKLHESCTI